MLAPEMEMGAPLGKKKTKPTITQDLDMTERSQDVLGGAVWQLEGQTDIFQKSR